MDHLPNGAELHNSLKEATGQKTVPYVYVSGQLVGGCDATKALIASGEFDKKLGAGAGTKAAGGDVAALQVGVKLRGGESFFMCVQAPRGWHRMGRPSKGQFLPGELQAGNSRWYRVEFILAASLLWQRLLQVALHLPVSWSPGHMGLGSNQ